MTTAFITHRDCWLHDMGKFHPECPDRLSAINDRLIAAGLDLYLSFYDAPLASRAQVERVHPACYVDDLLACLNALDTNEATPPDCVAIGIVRTDSDWRRIEDVTDTRSQARLVGRYPQLFARLASPSPVVEWLVAARQPELLRGPKTARTPSVRYAVRDIALGREVAFSTEGVAWPGLDASEAQALQAARTMP